MNPARRPHPAVAGVALVGAAVIAATPVTASLPRAQVADIQLANSEADIVIDFVRHAQTNPSGDVVAVATNGVPGFPLSTTGEEQATQVAVELQKIGGVEGIFGGQEQRMIETAMPYLTAEGLTAQDYQAMAGFNEISGGMYAGAPPGSPGNLLYELTVFAWALGLRSVPMTGSNDYNGNQFEENVSNAVNTIYNDAMSDPNPVHGVDGQIHDLVFSGGGLISGWPLMNVNNPDVAVFIPILLQTLTAGNANDFLANAGITQVMGNPEDGWTLLTFDGHPMPAYPGLLTELILDLRNVIVAPQTATYDVTQAVINGDSTDIEHALLTGLQNIGTAYAQFPGAVAEDISDAVQKLSTAVAGGESFSDAFGSIIIGLVPD